MIKYVFKDETLAIKNAKKANPQKIGEALAAVAEKAKGRLTPKAVIEAAKDQRNPLHKHFTWDDAEAANAFRLEQARTIIRCIRVEDRDAEDGMSRAFLSIADKDGTSYRTLDAVKASRDLQLAVLRQAERDLSSFERRYRELDDVCTLVRTAREHVVRRLSENETRAQ